MEVERVAAPPAFEGVVVQFVAGVREIGLAGNSDHVVPIARIEVIVVEAQAGGTDRPFRPGTVSTGSDLGGKADVDPVVAQAGRRVDVLDDRRRSAAVSAVACRSGSLAEAVEPAVTLGAAEGRREHVDDVVAVAGIDGGVADAGPGECAVTAVSAVAAKTRVDGRCCDAAPSCAAAVSTAAAAGRRV